MTPDIVESAYWAWCRDQHEYFGEPTNEIALSAFRAGYARAAQSPQAREPDIAKGLSDCGVGAPYGDGSAGEKAAMSAYTVLRCCNLIGAGDWRVPERIGNCTEAMVTKPLGTPLPQARDEGGAVEGWKLTGIVEEEDGGEVGLLIDLPNRTQIWLSDTANSTFEDQGPDICEALGGNAAGLFLHRSANDGTGTEILARVADLETGDELAKALARAMLAARPSPPTDAINTAEGEAWLAQRGETATGLMRREPTEPAGRLLGTDQSDVNADEGAGAAGEPPHLDAPWGLASAVASPPQAPRELTDEEAERGARELDPGPHWSPDHEPDGRRAAAREWARAVYRAITEEPAR